MTRTIAEKRAAFRRLHESGTFIIPNPWDLGSARLLAGMGFPALASTSSGYAWTRGRPDYAVTLDDVLGHLTELSATVDVPINADFESGFAREPEGVAANVGRAVATGIAGVSIEDRDGAGGLYEKGLAVERIAAALEAIRHSGADVLLVARTEGLFGDPKAIGPAIDKLVAFAAAGADVLYAPGVTQKADIAAIVRAVAPKPVNVLAMKPGISLAEYAELGVRRVSVGGSLARVAWNAVLATARELQAGDLTGLAAGVPTKMLNDAFSITLDGN
jgi:2-methylisocitrate lyase-like PEP mutase family enzyme